MKVALDISPVTSGHNVRGIGSYTQGLYNQFRKTKFDGIKFDFFENSKSEFDADIVHYPYFDLFFHTLPIRKRSRRVVTIHDVIPLVFPTYFPAGPRGFINFFFQKMALKNCDAVICDSKTSKVDIHDKLSVPSQKIHVIYLAPDEIFKKRNKPKNKLKLPPEFVLYVGDVNWNKNIPNLLEAIKISKKHLVLVGKAHKQDDLEETININRLIGKLGLKDMVVKTGFVENDQLADIYNLATVTLQPSFYEGFGLPVLESMACGTPVICSNVASLSEIASKETIFCDPTSPKDIAQKINQVFTLNSDRRQNLSQKLIDHAASFSWDKVAKQTVNVYKGLIK